MRQTLEADYLIIGAGATGLAFADEILRASRDARVVLVDRRAKAGGHWNDAYPFVTLHQPALYYGVNSERLGSGGGDLVSRQQILAYDECVIAKWKATGRLTFLPLCEHDAETGCVSSTIAPELDYEIRVRRKTVDSTYMNVTVPSTTPPGYEVAADVPLVPINTLATLEDPWSRYVIVGGGKTGIDAVLFLLDRGVDPDRIRWIVPNDAWFLNRASIMPNRLAQDIPAQVSCLRDSPDLDSAIRRLEAEGRLLRLDPAVWPTKYRCATVNEEELAALRRIDDVVRMGRVTRIDSSSIELTGGVVVAEPGSLYVDCTADGLARRPPRPVFEGDRITLQSISMCQPVFSAAAIAAIEGLDLDDARKNTLCRPVPHPEHTPDYVEAFRTTIENLDALARRRPLWALRSRLSIAHHVGLAGYVRLSIGIARWKRLDPRHVDALIEAAPSESAIRAHSSSPRSLS